MIKIVLDENLLSKDYIKDPDAFFNVTVLPEDITQIGEEVMQKIDNAKLLDKNLGSIQTPYGVTSLYNLSSGCKVVLLYLYFSKDENTEKILNLNECGWNAVKILFEIANDDNSGVSFFLNNSNSVLHLRKGQYRFLVNGNKVTTDLTKELWRRIW